MNVGHWMCGILLSATAGTQAPAEPDTRGVFVRPSGAGSTSFVPWEGEVTAQRELVRLTRAGGGDLVFAPGDYELERGLMLAGARDIRIAGSGAGTTRLHFAAGPEQRPTLLADVAPGAKTILVSGADALEPRRAYQLYRSDLRGDRILEFRVASVDGETVTLAAPARYMGHVEEIPAGSVVVEVINAFVVWESERITIERLEIDGVGRGDVHGHTTFCGVYAVGDYEVGELPTTSGLTVRDCRIHNLMGRGVCVYGMKDIDVSGNHIHAIDAQAIEIDHFSRGRVEENTIVDARAGVALDDAYDTVVRGNTVRDCPAGVALVKHFETPGFNVGNAVESNLIVDCEIGVKVQEGIRGNRITGNTFSGIAADRWIRQDGDANETEGNAALEGG